MSNPFKLILIITILSASIFVSGCLDDSTNEENAINITQNYGENNNTVLHVISSMINYSRSNNNDFNITGWSATKLNDNNYNVTFKYKENGLPNSIDFNTNIKTGRVIGLNKMGDDVVSIIHTFNPNLK